MTARAGDNPFRVDRLHELDYWPQGTTWDAMLDRLRAMRFRGAIVGPHGSGKTTLLHALVPRLSAIGLRPRLLFRNRDGSEGAYGEPWRETLATLDGGDVLLVDGYGHLFPLARLRLLRRSRAAAGLVVTCHGPGLLPTWTTTATSPALLAELVEHLAGAPDPDAAGRHRRHAGNLRAALRELYDTCGHAGSEASPASRRAG